MITHYTPNYEKEEEIVKRFHKGYSIFKNKENYNKATLDAARRFAYDAFKIDFQIREVIFPSLSDKLAEMVDEGFLKLEEKEISLADPATRSLCMKNIFKSNDLQPILY